MNTSFKHGSLFSGIGGFDLAAEWMGWENVFHCEWNPFGQKVLKHYWPNSISYNDITKTDFSIHRGTIDILTGGFPCQPYSAAGKRLGKEDERHLWPEMLRTIREIQPRWIVGENVLGLVNWNGGMVFEEVQADLEAEGYEVQPYVLPAAAVNAPHRRDRVWFVAFKDTNKDGWGSEQRKEESCKWEQRNSCTGNNERLRAYNDKIGSIDKSDKFNVADTPSERLEGSEWGSSEGNRFMCDGSNATDTNCEMLEHRNGCRKNGWDNKEIRVESFNGPRKWETFPTVSAICSRDDGLSNRLDGITFSKWRNESIKAGGNAIVPQVVFQIFKAIELFTIQNKSNDTNSSTSKAPVSR